MVDTPRVVGLDPSLTAFGIVDANGVGSTAGGAADMPHRLSSIRDAIERVIATSPCGTPPEQFNIKADLVVIEDLPTQAKGAGLTGQVQGIAREVCERHSVPFVTIVANSLKVFAADDGTADKLGMALAYAAAVGFDLKPGKLPSPTNAYRLGDVLIVKDGGQVDAWWLRQVGLAYLGAWGVPSTDRRTSCLSKLNRHDEQGRPIK